MRATILVGGPVPSNNGDLACYACAILFTLSFSFTKPINFRYSYGKHGPSFTEYQPDFHNTILTPFATYIEACFRKLLSSAEFESKLMNFC